MTERLAAPPAGMVDALLSRSALQVDKAVLKVMHRVFMAGRSFNRTPRNPSQWAHSRRLYSDPALVADPSRFHLPPESHLFDSRSVGRLPQGQILERTAPSSFRPMNPEFREEYLSTPENNRIHLWHLRHDRPRPSLLYLHGWGGGNPRFEMQFFPLRALYDAGLDVILVTLPFHGARRPAGTRFGGQLFPSSRVDRTNEGFAHAIHDIRAILAALDREGRSPTGVMGVSLGSYIGTLLAGLEKDLQFLIPMIPLADLADFMWDHGEGHRDRKQAEDFGISRDLLKDLFAVHTPLKLPLNLPPERILVVAGQGDGICDRRQTEALWHHAGRPAVHWFPGGHVAHFRRKGLRDALVDFALRWNGPASR